jgi:hypothetical protein
LGFIFWADAWLSVIAVLAMQLVVIAAVLYSLLAVARTLIAGEDEAIRACLHADAIRTVEQFTLVTLCRHAAALPRRADARAKRSIAPTTLSDGVFSIWLVAALVAPKIATPFAAPRTPHIPRSAEIPTSFVATVTKVKTTSAFAKAKTSSDAIIASNALWIVMPQL